MKTIAIFHGLFLLVSLSFAQVKTQLSESSIVPQSGMFQAGDIESLLDIGPVDLSQVLSADKLEEGANVPFRFGVRLEVNYSAQNSGKWFDVPGGKVWKLKIRSVGAYSLNFLFSELELPDGALLYIYNENKSMLYGPVSRDDVSSATFATDLIKGNTVIMELFEPGEHTGESRVQLSSVVHGYKNMFGPSPMLYGDADPGCTNDVKCAGPTYENAAGGVAMVLLADLTRWCSGSLLTNGCEDFTANLLTAFHCLDVGDMNPPNSCDLGWGNGALSPNEINRAQNFVFRFQYKSSTCDGPEPTPNQWYTFTGATYRAGWFETDFALLQMAQRPTGNINTGIRYLGWSRDNLLIPQTSYHHPMGDVMKISMSDGVHRFNAAPIIWDLGCGRTNVSPALSHWEVELTDGRTQRGSSGGAILDQPIPWAPRYVVGQLHGGAEECNPQTTLYGRFDLSWGMDNAGAFLPGRNIQNSLGPWLTNDPSLVTTSTLASPYIVKSGGGILRVCSTAVGFDLLDAPPSSTHNVVWTTSPNLTILSQGHSSISVKYSGSQAGAATITANISSKNTAVCTVSTPFSLSVQAGPFNLSQVTISGSSSVCAPACADFYAIVPGGHQPGYTYTWTPPTGWSSCGKHENWQCLCPPHGWSGSATVKVSVNNGCGASPLKAKPVSSSCGGFALAYYPNPAEDEVTVSFTDSADSEVSYAVSIYDTQGNEMYSKTSNRETITINTGTFPKGRYILNIIHKEGIIRKQIFISR